MMNDIEAHHWCEDRCHHSGGSYWVCADDGECVEHDAKKIVYESIWVVICGDGNRCRRPLDDGFWENAADDRESANQSKRELDFPLSTAKAQSLKSQNPKAYKAYIRIAKPEPCGPHSVVEYRPVTKE